MIDELHQRVEVLEIRVDAGEKRAAAIEARLGVIEATQNRHTNTLMQIQAEQRTNHQAFVAANRATEESNREMAQNVSNILSVLSHLKEVAGEP